MPDMNRVPKLFPTLFIGLGSTGLNILEKFQELLLEHYGKDAELGIFDFIAIETDGNAQKTKFDWGENKISLITATIPDLSVVRKAYEGGQRQHYKSWLNEDLLKYGSNRFIDGAQNIRMAGRLILFENWRQISDAISYAYSRINSPNIISDTYSFLSRHYKNHGQPLDNTVIETRPTIYIVGTLCGGTCSGMYIDLSFYLKEKFHQAGHFAPKIYGIFTIHDSYFLNTQGQAGFRINSANCWAAIKEYDYYYAKETNYSMKFPDGMPVNTHDSPLDWLYLVSCSGNNNVDRLNAKKYINGKPSVDSLNHMAAMMIFTETVGNLANVKDAIRTDYNQQPRANFRNAAGHPACISSFGLATIWYPKYRISLGASSNYSKQLCEQWVGLEDNSLSLMVEEDVKDNHIWEGLLKSTKDALIDSEIGTIYDIFKNDYKETYANELGNNFKRFAVEQRKNDKYDTIFRNSRNKARNNLKDDILAYTKEVVNKYNNIQAGLKVLNYFEYKINSLIKDYTESYPTISYDNIKADLLAKSLLKFKDVIKEIFLINLEKINDFHLRQLLDDILKDIEVIRNEIKSFERNLLNSISLFSKRYNDCCQNILNTQDVKIVTKNDKNEIKRDIDDLTSEMDKNKSNIINLFFKNNGLYEFLEHNSKLTSIMLEVLISEAINKTANFDLANKTLNLETATINFFAQEALPHLELMSVEPMNYAHSGDDGKTKYDITQSKVLASIEIGKPVTFIAGGNFEALTNIINKKLDPQLQRIFSISEKNPLPVPELSHMVIFYKEEPLIFMDDNIQTSGTYEDIYKSTESNYGFHVHKDGKSEFDILTKLKSKAKEVETK